MIELLAMSPLLAVILAYTVWEFVRWRRVRRVRSEWSRAGQAAIAAHMIKTTASAGRS